MELKRLYCITGKGGVGKSTISLALLKCLSEQGHDARLYTFDKSAYNLKSFEQLSSKIYLLKSQEALKDYIQFRFKGLKGLKWFIDTSIFQAFFNLLPGLSYVVVLGKIYDELKRSPQSYAILDGPALGHFNMMMKSLSFFQEIFRSGVFFDQLEEIVKYLQQDLMQVILVCLPEKASIDESVEFKSKLEELMPLPIEFWLNGLWQKTSWALENPGLTQLIKGSLPFKKIEWEKQLLKDLNCEMSLNIPHYSAEYTQKVQFLAQDLNQYIKKIKPCKA